MKISGFIDTLKKIKKAHGDMEIYLIGEYGLDLLDELYIEKYDSSKVIVFSTTPKIGG